MKGKSVAVVVEGNVYEQFICYENVKNPGIPVREVPRHASTLASFDANRYSLVICRSLVHLQCSK